MEEVASLEYVTPMRDEVCSGILSDYWHIDTCATVSVTPWYDCLFNVIACSKPIRGFGGEIVYATAKGDVIFVFKNQDDEPCRFLIRGVLFVESAPRNLISEPVLRGAGCILHMEQHKSFFVLRGAATGGIPQTPVKYSPYDAHSITYFLWPQG